MGDYLDRVHEQYAHILAFLQRYDWAAVDKPAVVMDIDETAICNIRGARWRGFDMTRRAIPGALAVANYLAMRGVAVYFVSARPHTALEFSTRQLHAEGFKFRLVVHQNRERQPDYGAYKRGARGDCQAPHHRGRHRRPARGHGQPLPPRLPHPQPPLYRARHKNGPAIKWR